MSYEVKLSSRARNDLYQIRDYIADVLKAPATAQKVLDKLTKSFSRLILFPQAGFNVDKKLGVQLHSSYQTYGYVYGKYLIFYTIHERESVVWTSHILDSRSDYLTLLMEGDNE